MMMNNTSALEADLDYAERMVRKGFGTPEQAAHICGVQLSDLLARLATQPHPGYAPQPQH